MDNSKPRMTLNKKLTLAALRPDNIDRCPPYTAQQVADHLGKPLPNVLRTLKQLETEGLVCSEIVINSVYCIVPKRPEGVYAYIKTGSLLEHGSHEPRQAIQSANRAMA